MNSRARRVNDVRNARAYRCLDGRVVLTPASLTDIQGADQQHLAGAGEGRHQRVLVVEISIPDTRAAFGRRSQGARLAGDENQLRSRHSLQQQLGDHPAEGARCSGDDNTHYKASAGTQLPWTPERNRIGTLILVIAPFSRLRASKMCTSAWFSSWRSTMHSR